LNAKFRPFCVCPFMRTTGRSVTSGLMLQGILDNARDGFTAEEIATEDFAPPPSGARLS